MPKHTTCLRIPKRQGEDAIVLINKLDLIDKSLDIKRDEQNLYLPLSKPPKEAELVIIKSKFPDFRLMDNVFEEKIKISESLSQVLQGKLPTNLLKIVPQSFDVIGNIVIIEIPKELSAHENLIGEAILEIHRNIKTVLSKAGDINGVYRIRPYVFLAGENNTRTIHREFGCQYHVDIAKAYFSPRLSHEHERVANLVETDEIVVDLFAGVGPFSVLIAKKNPKAKIFAVDINPEAVDLLRNNVTINKVNCNVFPLLADAREVAAGKLLGIADRVIMNLPETAYDYIDAACSTIKPEGGVVHFYSFVRSPNSIEKLMQCFTEAVKRTGRNVEALLYCKSIRETAPYESQVVLDVKIN